MWFLLFIAGFSIKDVYLKGYSRTNCMEVRRHLYLNLIDSDNCHLILELYKKCSLNNYKI